MARSPKLTWEMMDEAIRLKMDGASPMVTSPATLGIHESTFIDESGTPKTSYSTR